MTKRVPSPLMYLFAYFAFPTIGYAAEEVLAPNPIGALVIVLIASIILSTWAVSYFFRKRDEPSATNPKSNSPSYHHFLLKSVIYGTSLVLLTNCSSLGKSLLLGTGIGAGAGAGIGLAASHNGQGAAIGGAVGAVLGGAMSFLIHDNEQRKKFKLKKDEFRKWTDQPDNDLPTINAPEASCIKLDERIDGNTYFGPQLKCTIEKSAVWSR
jgi:membrane associated rhomboid family serine protease